MAASDASADDDVVMMMENRGKRCYPIQQTSVYCVWHLHRAGRWIQLQRCDVEMRRIVVVVGSSVLCAQGCSVNNMNFN